jgi:hypothetical protein
MTRRLLGLDGGETNTHAVIINDEGMLHHSMEALNRNDWKATCGRILVRHTVETLMQAPRLAWNNRS